jgi:hypothetical protein
MGPEVGDPLDFNVGFFSDAGDVDVQKQVWAYKKGQEIMRRTAICRGEIAASHPPFPDVKTVTNGTANITIDDSTNGVEGGAQRDAGTIKDLEYIPADDKIFEQFLRETINTKWHSLGTTKMAPREQLISWIRISMYMWSRG